MVAFHYPPFSASSGYLRTSFFSRYLPNSRWKPTILTVRPSVYSSVINTSDSFAGSPEVMRTWALDTSRTLSWRGKYPLFLALPDRWVSWTLSAIVTGLRKIRQNHFQILWTTFPIPTAVLIGFVLKKLTNIPWVVDIRDVILDDDFPETRQERSVYAWLEQKVATNADAVVVTTAGALDIYQHRYPALSSRLHCIPNGFDETAFRKAESTLAQVQRNSTAAITLVHSGLLSRVDRDPTKFFDALSNLVRKGSLNPSMLKVVLRACGDENHYRNEIAVRNLSNIVRFEPAIPYEDAIFEMFRSDGLLLFQGSTCNHAVPAKLYEYLRCKKPLLAITDAAGNVAQLLRKLGTGVICDSCDAEDIAEKLLHTLDQIRTISFTPLSDRILNRYSRESQARQLSLLLERLRKS